jgi:hypothetical protein
VIDQEHSHVKSLGHETEFAVNIDNPLDQESSGSVFDFSGQLNFRKIVWLQLEAFFAFAHICEYLCRKLSHVLRISHVELICESHLLHD